MKSIALLCPFIFLSSCSFFDTSPPSLKILSPENETLVSPLFIVKGTAYDNQLLQTVEVAIDDLDFQNAEGFTNWYFRASAESSGVHLVTVRAVDYAGNQTVRGVRVHVK